MDIDGLEEIGPGNIPSPVHSPRNEGAHNEEKKRSRSEDNLTIMMDGIKDAVSVIRGEIAKPSHASSKSNGVNAKISGKRQKIDPEIRRITSLTTEEIIKAACDHQLTDVFFSMTDEDKEKLLGAILRGKA